MTQHPLRVLLSSSFYVGLEKSPSVPVLTAKIIRECLESFFVEFGLSLFVLILVTALHFFSIVGRELGKFVGYLSNLLPTAIARNPVSLKLLPHLFGRELWVEEVGHPHETLDAVFPPSPQCQVHGAPVFPQSLFHFGHVEKELFVSPH